MEELGNIHMTGDYREMSGSCENSKEVSDSIKRRKYFYDVKCYMGLYCDDVNSLIGVYFRT